MKICSIIHVYLSKIFVEVLCRYLYIDLKDLNRDSVIENHRNGRKSPPANDACSFVCSRWYFYYYTDKMIAQMFCFLYSLVAAARSFHLVGSISY